MSAPRTLADLEPDAAPALISALPPDAPLLEHARIYAERGWEIMPRVVARDGVLIDGLHGSPRTGLLSLEAVEDCWARYPQTRALAVVLGPRSGAFVLDVDQHEDGADGLAELAALEAEHGRLAPTPFVLTPSGWGRHLYFRWPASPIRSCAIAPGLEVLAEGAAANLPPSQKRGRPYRWSLSRHPDFLELAEAPEWLLRLAAPPPPPPRRSRPTNGERHPRYVESALIAETEIVRSALPGSHNVTLNTSAWKLARFVAEGVLSGEALEEELLAAALSAGMKERRARATIRAAIKGRRR